MRHHSPPENCIITCKMTRSSVTPGRHLLHVVLEQFSALLSCVERTARQRPLRKFFLEVSGKPARQFQWHQHVHVSLIMKAKRNNATRQQLSDARMQRMPEVGIVEGWVGFVGVPVSVRAPLEVLRGVITGTLPACQVQASGTAWSVEWNPASSLPECGNLVPSPRIRRLIWQQAHLHGTVHHLPVAV